MGDEDEGGGRTELREWCAGTGGAVDTPILIGGYIGL